MRTKNAVMNIAMSLVAQVIIVLLGFLSRKIFVNHLGVEYLGVNGLLTNVLSMMVLIESGIGISIVYNLYRPLAENNHEEITALVQTYKKAYRILAIIMVVISSAFYPFLKYLIKGDAPILGIGIVYTIFVAKNVVSYLNAYKWALINADQKGYVLARNNMIFQILTTILKIIVLVSTQNYIFYLLIELIVFIVQNIVNTRAVYKRYPYILEKQRYELKPETKQNINKNVRAMFFHNIGGYLVCSTDNILISSCISVSAVGLYSNYSMIISQLTALISPVTSGIAASVGNLIATEEEDKVYSIFKISYLIDFWIYSFAAIFLFNLLEPFINWWIGEGYLLDFLTFFFILLNFYLSGMRHCVTTFKSKAGLFVQDKYAPVIEGFINLGASLLCIKFWGLAGVFMGTVLSTLLVPFWNQVRIVYKELFKRSVWGYFKQYAIYMLIMIGVGGVITASCHFLVQGNNFMALVLKGMLCVIGINGLYMLVFWRTKEFQYLWQLIKAQFIKLMRKVRWKICKTNV